MKCTNHTKFGFYLMTAIFLTLGLSISLQSLLAAWTPATDSPPNVNMDVPINEGPDPQTKLGDLILGDDLSVEGRVQLDQSTSNDVWIQGGALGTSGDPRNLAFLGVKSTDQLRINYGGEYTGGVRIQGPSTTIDNNTIVKSLLWESGVNRITNNDGGGNVQIRFGNDYSDSDERFTHAGTAFYVGGSLDSAAGTMVMKVASNGGAGDDQPVTWGESLTLSSDTLTFGGNIIADEPTEDNHVATKGWVEANAGGGGATMISAESVPDLNIADSVNYCWDLSASAEYAMNGDTTTVYTDWRLPSMEEAMLFIGRTSDTSLCWTTTPSSATIGDNKIIRMTDGYWTYQDYYDSESIRCVR